MFRYALFTIVQTGKNPFMCDSEKDDTTETEKWSVVARDWEWGEGLMTMRHKGIFSGGRTVAVKFDSCDSYTTAWVC